MLVQGQIEPIRVVALTHGFQAAGHPLRVAMLASWADLVAPGDGIPGGAGPFDFGFVGQFSGPQIRVIA